MPPHESHQDLARFKVVFYKGYLAGSRSTEKTEPTLEKRVEVVSSSIRRLPRVCCGGISTVVRRRTVVAFGAWLDI